MSPRGAVSRVPAALWVLLAAAASAAALWLLRGVPGLEAPRDWLQAHFGFLEQPAGFGISEGCWTSTPATPMRAPSPQG